MLNMLPSILILGLAALAALGLAVTRRSPREDVSERHAAARALAIAVALQAVHFAEEAATGLNDQLGALVGQPGIPLAIFVAFNVTWLVIWIASVFGLRSGRVPAFFAAWFLAIAGMINGVGHPLLSLIEGRYFPGLVTSPLIGIAGVWLWLRLRTATQASRMQVAA